MNSKVLKLKTWRSHHYLVFHLHPQPKNSDKNINKWMENKYILILFQRCLSNLLMKTIASMSPSLN